MNPNNGNNNGNGAHPEHSSNGHSSNGVGLHQLNLLATTIGNGEVLAGKNVPVGESRRTSLPPNFDSAVVLQQSDLWSRFILWGLMSVTAVAIVWACVAQIEEAVSATGKLEPTGTVKEVQAPVGGVVKTIYVEDGQTVKKGDRLVSLDPTAALSQLAAAQKIRISLLQENQFYRTQMNGSPNRAALEREIFQLKLPSELVSLTKSRAALSAENQLYRSLIDGKVESDRMTTDQQERFFSTTSELSSRVAAAKLETEQLTKQLSQATIRYQSARETLKMNQGILKDLVPLTKTGAISRIQTLKQQQEVQTSTAEAAQLQQEVTRLQLAIDQAQSKVQNTVALSRKEWLTQIAENDQRIAEIDSSLTKAIVENHKRVAEIDSQLSTAQLSLRYSELTAPASGTVFDLQAHTPGFVASSSQPILKIVPDDALTAKVFITNRDIGFVKEGMEVDVRIDSFPFSEFGDVKGKLIWIGSDALPPDQINPYYRFPAKVKLQRQSLLVNGRNIPLQSGMSVSTNVKVRSRPVMSIFTDLFTRSIDSLKSVR